MDRSGVLWALAGATLSRFVNGRFEAFQPGLLGATRAACEDRNGGLLAAGFAGVVRILDGRTTRILPASALAGETVSVMIPDRRGNVWIGGSQGLLQVTAAGGQRRYGTREGLRNPFVRALLEDGDGNIWAGGDGGLARVENGKIETPDASEGEIVTSLLEDREGDLWIGSSHGLTRLRDGLFANYGLSEGMPSDQPGAVYQDRAGRIWVGFHDIGLMRFLPARKLFGASDGMPACEVFTIGETRSGDLLVSTSLGLFREADGHFQNYSHADPWGGRAVFDALEDSAGRIWAASVEGLNELRGGSRRNAIAGGPPFAQTVVSLLEGPDGALWAGTQGRGLWRVKGAEKRLYTSRDGLGSDEIRGLYKDADGTIWIGTFGGGLNSYSNGEFRKFTTRDGLPSDNVASIIGDGEWLWLSTTRGLCRLSRRQLSDYSEHRRGSLTPEIYGMMDGLRSAHYAAYPLAGGGTRSADGRLWFTTSRGLAVFDPSARKQPAGAPMLHILGVTADGQDVSLSGRAKLEPADGRLQIRYTGIYLSAPERVEYFQKLAGLDAGWVSVGNRRMAVFNSLKPGRYKFNVRAKAPGGAVAQESFAFEVLPHYYETVWFRLASLVALLAALWGAYRLRLRSIGQRFSLVLQERARLAREIHDTLAQGYVGISSQLDAVAMCMPEGASPARKYLDLARGMARHSLTEARRSVMDLRAAALESQELHEALVAGGARLGDGVWRGDRSERERPAKAAAWRDGAAPAPHCPGGGGERDQALRGDEDSDRADGGARACAPSHIGQWLRFR